MALAISPSLGLTETLVGLSMCAHPQHGYLSLRYAPLLILGKPWALIKTRQKDHVAGDSDFGLTARPQDCERKGRAEVPCCWMERNSTLCGELSGWVSLLPVVKKRPAFFSLWREGVVLCHVVSCCYMLSFIRHWRNMLFLKRILLLEIQSLRGISNILGVIYKAVIPLRLV